MLTREDNDLLTRTGPGTPMGHLMRRYWVPVVQSSELAAGGRVKRVKLLDEDLVVFRAPDGRVAVLGEFCAHRRASLYFGRNEAAGLRCVYHGWQYDVDGRCVDMANEPPEYSFQDKVRQPAYPCVEHGGVVWTFMGPAEATPGLPAMEWTLVPETHRFVSKFWQECNYLQALEGGVDPAHISFLHSVLDVQDEALKRDLEKAAAGFDFAAQLARAPHMEAVDTPVGVLIGARRDAPAGRYYWRITQFLLPFHTMPPPDVGPEAVLQSHVWVPVDDEHLVNWCISWHPSRPLTEAERAGFQAGLGIHVTAYGEPTGAAYGDIRPLANRGNDHRIDWEAQRTRKFFGVQGVGTQDKAITESQQPVYDRTREYLGRADIGIIRVRRRLLEAARELADHGTAPPGLDPASHLIRPAAALLPKDVTWTEGARDLLVVPPR